LTPNIEAKKEREKNFPKGNKKEANRLKSTHLLYKNNKKIGKH